MAFYIRLEKVFEDALTAQYRFSTHVVTDTYLNAKGQARSRAVEKHGLAEISKATGEVSILKAIEDRNIYSLRAAYKLRQHWEDGAFPEVTSYNA